MSIDISLVPAENLYFGVFAKQATNSVETNYVQFVVSDNGQSVDILNARRRRSDGVAIEGYDPDWHYKDGVFTISVTAGSTETCDAIVYQSRDLLTFDKLELNFGATPVRGTTLPGATAACTLIWAPQIVEDGDTFGLLVSLQTAADFTNDEGKTDTHFFRPYYVPITQYHPMTLGEPQALDMGALTGSLIDPDIWRVDENTLLMAIKDEDANRIIICESDDGTLFGTWSLKTTITEYRAEGPQFTQSPTGALRLFFDVYGMEKTQFVDSSDDFATYGTATDLEIEGQARHGSIKRLDQFDQPVELAGKIARIGGFRAPYGKTRDGAFFRKTYDSTYQPGTKLSSGANSLTPTHEYSYYVSSTDVAEVTLGKNNRCSRFFMEVRSSSESAGIKVLNGSYYEAANGVADWIGFGNSRYAVVEFVRGRNQEKFQIAGVVSRDLGCLPWASRPTASQYTGYEFTVTDVGVHRWVAYSDGTNWLPRSRVTLARGTTDLTKTDTDTSKTALVTYNIPANVMGPNASIEIAGKVQLSANDADVKTLSVELGGSTLFTQSLANIKTATIDKYSIENRNSRSSQLGTADALVGGGTTASASYRTSSVDMSSAQDLTISGQYAVSGGGKSFSLKSYKIELVPG